MKDSKYQACIEACLKCFTDCQSCLYQMATQKSMNDCPRCCIECVDACQVAIKAMINDSKWAGDYCKICAEICEWCAKECKEHTDDHCKACAESCRKCAEECRKMAA